MTTMWKKLLVILFCLLLIAVGIRATRKALFNKPQPEVRPTQALDAAALQETWIKEWIKILNDYADVLESVKDRESARIAANNIERLTKQVEIHTQRRTGLPSVSQSDSERITKTTMPEMQRVQKHLEAVAPEALERGSEDPAFIDALEKLVEVTSKLAKELDER